MCALLIAIQPPHQQRPRWRETFLASAGTTMILFILIGAFVLQFILAFLGLPALISNWVISMQLTQTQVVDDLSTVPATSMEELSMVVTNDPDPPMPRLGVELDLSSA